MNQYQICGLGNAIVDIFLELSEAEFAALGFERGTMRLVELGEQRDLLAPFKDREPRLVSGGSVANSVIAFSQLGGDAAFIGCVGDDRYGLFYQNEFEELDIDIGNPVIVGESTGTCVAIITPVVATRRAWIMSPIFIPRPSQNALSASSSLAGSNGPRSASTRANSRSASGTPAFCTRFLTACIS